MIKIIGAVLITASAAAVGLGSVYRLRQRVRSLGALASAIDTIKSEVCDRLTPMPELFELMAAEAAYPANLLFRNASGKLSELGEKTFPVLWLEAIRATPELLLTDGEEQVLKDLGVTMGRYQAEEQKSGFLYAQRRLEVFLQAAEAVRDTNSRMQAALGVAAGLFAVIVLI